MLEWMMRRYLINERWSSAPTFPGTLTGKVQLGSSTQPATYDSRKADPNRSSRKTVGNRSASPPCPANAVIRKLDNCEAIMSRTAVQSAVVEPSGSISIQTSKRVTINATPKIASSSPEIWWTNAIFFLAFHIVGLSAWYTWPSSWRTWFLCYINWQIGTLGITIGNPLLSQLTVGYHRLWSHRSFTARVPLRIVLAAMGTLGFQGSIRYHP
jgi:hypothetical protein